MTTDITSVTISVPATTELTARAKSSDRHKSIVEWQWLVTNVPEAISLGAAVEEKGGDYRWDSSWERTTRIIHVDELPEGGFVAIGRYFHSTGCNHGNGDSVFRWLGRMPDLTFGDAYASWARQMEDEAYAFLLARAQGRGRKLRRTIRFAAGVACDLAPHDLRRRAWVSALRALGVRGNVSRIIGSVRTATCKAALRLDWKPSVAQPAHWEGYPPGVVKISLED